MYRLAWALCSVIMVTKSEWVFHTNPALPRAAQLMAAGYWEDTIFLLGGYEDRTQLTSYNITSETFTDYGASYLNVVGNSQGEWGYGHFTQLDNTLFTISWDGGYIHSYQLDGFANSDGVDGIYREEAAIPTDVSSHSCLASSTTPTLRIYVTGGTNGGVLSTVQVLEIGEDGSSSYWLDNVPSMLSSRVNHGCTVLNDNLYVLGWVDAVEAISTTNIVSSEWEEVGSFPVPLSNFGQVVAYNNVIYIVGGNQRGNGYSDGVYAFDTMTNEVTLHSTLPDAIMQAVAVMVGPTIYAFGGHDGTDPLDCWMTYTLPSPAPTDEPTDGPTKALPTNYPTMIPSLSPTVEPTLSPSRDPTGSPSHSPTADPTAEPTAVSTATPSVDPTSEPTNEPTIDPTTEPTTEPTMEPTNYSTVEPTLNPTVNPAADPTAEATSDSSSDSQWQRVVISTILLVLCMVILFVIWRKVRGSKGAEDSEGTAGVFEGKGTEVAIVAIHVTAVSGSVNSAASP